MGSGTRAAGTLYAEAVDNMKDQMLIVLINRLGGKVSMHVDEIDDTGGFICTMSVEGQTFHFEIGKKQSNPPPP